MTASLPNPAAPESYPRRVLLMVTGRTPQVVTETLFALCLRRTPTFVPTEVRLITTAEGADDARLSLLSKDPGWFHAPRSDYRLPEIAFGVDHIAELHDSEGRPLPDIRTDAENDRAADQIVAYVRNLTSDPACALHVSLAGGRKTMGYFLGYALSLFGRPQDRLSHVLVSAPYESNREIFYPSPINRRLHVEPLKRYFDAKDAVLTLADNPFMPLRNALPGRFQWISHEQRGETRTASEMPGAPASPAISPCDRAGGLNTAIRCYQLSCNRERSPGPPPSVGAGRGTSGLGAPVAFRHDPCGAQLNGSHGNRCDGHPSPRMPCAGQRRISAVALQNRVIDRLRSSR